MNKLHIIYKASTHLIKYIIFISFKCASVFLVTVGGATAATSVQVLPKDSAVLDAGCAPQTISPQRESPAVPCANRQDMEETSAATEVSAARQIG